MHWFWGTGCIQCRSRNSLDYRYARHDEQQGHQALRCHGTSTGLHEHGIGNRVQNDRAIETSCRCATRPQYATGRSVDALGYQKRTTGFHEPKPGSRSRVDWYPRSRHPVRQNLMVTVLILICLQNLISLDPPGLVTQALEATTPTIVVAATGPASTT